MKAILKIECIGDNYDQNLRFWKNITTQLAGKQLAEATFGKSKASYFVAEIIGFNDKYRYERIFLSCQKDYKDSNGTGSRGIYAYFLLEEGKIYDVLKPYSWKNSHRFFCTVDKEGNIITLTKEQVDQCLRNRLE